MCLITYWQRKTGSVQPASVSWAAPEPVSPAAVWSTFISPRTTGREVLGSTGGSHRFQADKGCYGREFSDFQNIKMLSFYCVLFDDHCLVSGLRRPFWLHQHSGDDFPDSQPGPGEKTTRGVSVGCGSRVTGGCEKHLAWWVGGGGQKSLGLPFGSRSCRWPLQNKEALELPWQPSAGKQVDPLSEDYDHTHCTAKC